MHNALQHRNPALAAATMVSRGTPLFGRAEMAHGNLEEAPAM